MQNPGSDAGVFVWRQTLHELEIACVSFIFRGRRRQRASLRRICFAIADACFDRHDWHGARRGNAAVVQIFRVCTGTRRALIPASINHPAQRVGLIGEKRHAPNKRSRPLQVATKPDDTRLRSTMTRFALQKLSLGSRAERAHYPDMFNYDASADLYTKRSGMKAHRKTTYRRFSNAAEAIHFAVESLTPELLQNAQLEVGEERFTVDQIRSLYDDIAFPLRRNRRGGS
jgi:hypothetical protein